MIGVAKIILAEAKEENKKAAFKKAFKLYFGRMKYIKCLLNYTHRYDLNGKECAEITEKDRNYAIELIEKNQ